MHVWLVCHVWQLHMCGHLVCLAGWVCMESSRECKAIVHARSCVHLLSGGLHTLHTPKWQHCRQPGPVARRPMQKRRGSCLVHHALPKMPAVSLPAFIASSPTHGTCMHAGPPAAASLAGGRGCCHSHHHGPEVPVGCQACRCGGHSPGPGAGDGAPQHADRHQGPGAPCLT